MKPTVAFIAAAAMAAFASSAASAATVNLTTSVGPFGGSQVEDFNELNLGGVTNPTTLSGINGAVLTIDQGSPIIANGTTPNVSAAPFPAGGVDTTNYLAVTGGSKITITLASAANYLGLLWGSVDKYNTIDFEDASGHILTSFTGADFISSNGDQSAAGTFYANFVSSVPFMKVVLSSTENSFEVDDVAISNVPLPAALPLFGAALMGMGLFGRKRRNGQAAV